MNETAKVHRDEAFDARILLGEDCIVYDGLLGELVEHTLGMIFVLIGVDEPFLMGWDGQQASQRAALVPPSCAHTLAFRGRTLTCCIYPHHPLYGGLLHAVAQGPLRSSQWGGCWENAVRCWEDHRSLHMLWEGVASHWDVELHGAILDGRVSTILEAYARGEKLDASMSTLGRWVGLSASRLTHLFRDEVGVGMRRVRLGYRLQDIARRVRAGEDFTRAAHAAGFSDSAHLSRSFRGIFGLSPSRAVRGRVQWL